jgi:hypothetical protein
MALEDMRHNKGQRPVVKVENVVEEEEETGEPEIKQEARALTAPPDLAALLQTLPDDEALPDNPVKITIYLSPEQHERLITICKTYTTKEHGVPENIQNLMRYIFEELPMETFAAMPDFVRRKKMEQHLAQGQKELLKYLQRFAAKSRKITGGSQ